jgi:hypothetical protein
MPCQRITCTCHSSLARVLGLDEGKLAWASHLSGCGERSAQERTSGRQNGPQMLNQSFSWGLSPTERGAVKFKPSRM